MTQLDDTSQGWPLPHPDNPARLDIERIRTTLEAVAIAMAATVTQADIDAAIDALVDGAPVSLDKINELAAALGNDENFAATVMAAIALKANTADLKTVATTGKYDDLTGKPTLGTAAAKDTGTATGNVVVLVDVDGSPGLPSGIDGSGLTGVVASSPFVQVGSAVTMSGASVTVTDLPQDASDLKIVVAGASVSESADIKIEVSNDNGTSWSSQAYLKVAATASGTLGGNIYLLGYATDIGMKLGFLESDTALAMNIASNSNAGALAETYHSGGMNAFRISASAGTFDAGTITVFKR